jgi:hypothetical protein
MTIALVEQNRALWLNLRNYLYPIIKAEVLVERDLAILWDDKVRAGLIDHYLDTEDWS